MVGRHSCNDSHNINRSLCYPILYFRIYEKGGGSISIVDTAKSAVGNIKYKFGASNITDSGKGTADCSSFSQWVLGQNGVKVGRTTNDQWSSDKGTNVQKTDLAKGDLVFFKNTYNSGYKDGVSHVGVYIGNGKFVHNSSSAGKVTISDLNSSYYSSHYLGAKRFDEKKNPTVKDDGADVGKNVVAELEPARTMEAVKLKWWGELIVLCLTVVLVTVAIVFFLKSFGVSNPIAKKLPI